MIRYYNPTIIERESYPYVAHSGRVVLNITPDTPIKSYIGSTEADRDLFYVLWVQYEDNRSDEFYFTDKTQRDKLRDLIRNRKKTVTTQLSDTGQVSVPRYELEEMANFLQRGIDSGDTHTLCNYAQEAKRWLQAICSIEQNASTVSAGSFS